SGAASAESCYVNTVTVKPGAYAAESDVVKTGTVKPGVDAAESDSVGTVSGRNVTTASVRPVPGTETSTTHVAVPAISYRVNGKHHVMPVLNPPPIPRMRIDPAPETPTPVFDSHPYARAGGITGGAFGANYHTPVYGRGMGMWVGMPTGGGGFISMPIR
ncbi:MAG: hypothetical protein Q4C47_03560, partial [Planctomycetia bacterium]|nr:hypothetical protein [Planctomycetia bacterium]